ncbi:MAG: hypothetical protein J6Z05_06630 [Lachnospiraceae bacterium]|nr:hypothetical protein [Lachnospiraceae bacterium]
MDIAQLKTELKKMGFNDRSVHIGESPYCEECFNLIKLDGGKWEIFYGEHGQKTNPRVYDTEEEACEGLLKMIKGDEPAIFNKPSIFDPVRRPDIEYPGKYKATLGIMIFFCLLGAGLSIFAFVRNYCYLNALTCLFIVLTAFFCVMAYCYTDKDRYEKFEYYLTPLFFSILILFFIFICIVAFLYFIKRIKEGESLLENIASLVMVEASFGTFIFIFFYFYIRPYIRKKDSEDK